MKEIIQVPEIQPFFGLRYNPQLVRGSEVISPPYDIVKSSDLRLLRTSDSEIDSHRKYHASILENPSPTPTGYKGVLANIKAWTEADVLIKDSTPSVYLYEQIFKLPENDIDDRKIVIVFLKVIDNYKQNSLNKSLADERKKEEAKYKAPVGNYPKSKI